MTDQTAKNQTYIVCEECSLELTYGEFYQVKSCPRCGHRMFPLIKKSLSKSLSFSLTALIFYIPAMILPFMKMELYGTQSSATIWGGVVSLTNAGSWFIAGIVFLASILIPVIKLGVLFFISSPLRSVSTPYANTLLYRFVEYIGRWSMLDIFLLAVLVAILKLEPWTSVEPQLGALMFGLVVIFTMLASASFDPRLLWRSENDEKQEA